MLRQQSVRTDVKEPTPKYVRETKKITIRSVIDPVTNRPIPVSQAIAKGILNQSKGQYINTATGDSMLVSEAIDRGLISAEVELVQKEETTEAKETRIIAQRDVTYTIVSALNTQTGEIVPVAQAIKDGIVNQEKGEYKDLATGKVMSLSDAIDAGKVQVENG